MTSRKRKRVSRDLRHLRHEPKAVAMLRDTTIWLVYAGETPDDPLEVSHFGMWVLFDDGTMKLYDAKGEGIAMVASALPRFIGIMARAGTLNDPQSAAVQAAKLFESELKVYWEQLHERTKANLDGIRRRHIA